MFPHVCLRQVLINERSENTWKYSVMKEPISVLRSHLQRHRVHQEGRKEDRQTETVLPLLIFSKTHNGNEESGEYLNLNCKRCCPDNPTNVFLRIILLPFCLAGFPLAGNYRVCLVIKYKNAHSECSFKN